MPQADARPTGYDEWASICAKDLGDPVSTKFCAGDRPPALRSLVDLEHLLELDNPSTSGLFMTGHSTGLGLRSVTPLNPRAFLMSQTADMAFEVLAFARGEQFVELVGNDARDLTKQTPRFFLLRFDLPCDTAPSGCNHADLLTPAVESGWTGYTLYDEEALAGTTLDCLTCHQPDGPGSRKIIRMQELVPTHTHWFGASGVESFRDMHAGENYAGRPIEDLHDASSFEAQIRWWGFGEQPNRFDSVAIDNELAASGSSATWQALYDNAVAGLAIPPPYFGADQTDPIKRANMIAAYHQVMAGTLARDQLPDTRDIVMESALPAMSVRPKLGLDGRGILVHMCSQCHNSRLDQTLTRARFNVMALDSMSRTEKDLAIFRLQLDDSDPKKMPPPRFRALSDEERALAIVELAK